MWDAGSKAGLALAAVSTIYMFVTQFLGSIQMNAFISMLLSMVLWAAKFGGCIWLMMFFMKKFAYENPDADNSATFRFGVIVSLLSAFVFAAANFANIGYISADLYQAQIEQVLQMMAPQMDSQMLEAMEDTMSDLPLMMFIYTLIYCFIFGTVLSAILSRNIPSRNPFETFNPDEQ